MMLFRSCRTTPTPTPRRSGDFRSPPRRPHTGQRRRPVWLQRSGKTCPPGQFGDLRSLCIGTQLDDHGAIPAIRRALLLSSLVGFFVACTAAVFGSTPCSTSAAITVWRSSTAACFWARGVVERPAGRAGMLTHQLFLAGGEVEREPVGAQLDVDRGHGCRSWPRKARWKACTTCAPGRLRWAEVLRSLHLRGAKSWQLCSRNIESFVPGPDAGSFSASRRSHRRRGGCNRARWAGAS